MGGGPPPPIYFSHLILIVANTLCGDSHRVIPFNYKQNFQKRREKYHD